MKITGTLINYYFHCKRQCWLFGHKLNLEDNSEEVRIGRVLHEIKRDEGKKTEIAIENIKIDKITDDYLVEFKKSDADVDAVKWQVLLYLKILKDKGIEKKGKINFIEKKKTDKTVVLVELDEETEKRLGEISEEILEFLNDPIPPSPELKKGCKKCAYYEYCFI